MPKTQSLRISLAQHGPRCGRNKRHLSRSLASGWAVLVLERRSCGLQPTKGHFEAKAKKLYANTAKSRTPAAPLENSRTHCAAFESFIQITYRACVSLILFPGKPLSTRPILELNFRFDAGVNDIECTEAYKAYTNPKHIEDHTYNLFRSTRYYSNIHEKSNLTNTHAHT